MTRFCKSSLIFSGLLLTPFGCAARPTTTPKAPKKEGKAVESPRTRRRLARLHHKRPVVRHARRHYERFMTSSFAGDITEGDQYAGEDAVVRQASIDALGNMNGTIDAIDPTSDRIVAMVNPTLALADGAHQCQN